MKTFTTRMMIFAAAIGAAATMAYGQNQTKADIPFAFSTANASEQAGTYTFTRMSSLGSIDRIRVSGTGSNQILISLPLDTYRTAKGNPSVVFACASEGCALREIRTWEGTFVYPSSHKHGQDAKPVALISVPLTTLKSE